MINLGTKQLPTGVTSRPRQAEFRVAERRVPPSVGIGTKATNRPLQAGFRTALTALSMIVALLLLSGCNSPYPGQTATRSPGGGSGLSEMNAESIARLQVAIEEQNRQILQLRELLQTQEAGFNGDLQKFQQSLDLHLELLTLYYQRLAELDAAPTAAPPSPPPARTSLSGTLRIERTSAPAIRFQGATVRLLDPGTELLWKSAGTPKTLFNTPVRNPDPVFATLQIKDDSGADSTNPEGDEVLQAAQIPLHNSFLEAYEKSLQPVQQPRETLTDNQGNFRFASVVPGDHVVYVRVSTEVYSLAWMIPVSLQPGESRIVSLDRGNVQVFLNDREAP